MHYFQDARSHLGGERALRGAFTQRRDSKGEALAAALSQLLEQAACRVIWDDVRLQVKIWPLRIAGLHKLL